MSDALGGAEAPWAALAPHCSLVCFLLAMVPARALLSPELAKAAVIVMLAIAAVAANVTWSLTRLCRGAPTELHELSLIHISASALLVPTLPFRCSPYHSPQFPFAPRADALASRWR